MEDLRCSAVVLLGEAVLGAGLPGVPAAVGLCHLWEGLLPNLWARLLARRRGPAQALEGRGAPPVEILLRSTFFQIANASALRTATARILTLARCSAVFLEQAAAASAASSSSSKIGRAHV